MSMLRQMVEGTASVGAQLAVGLVVMAAAGVFIAHALWWGRRR